LKGLRIVFMGTPQFAIPSLEKIHQSHHSVVGIVTQPDRPKGRGKKISAPPVKEYAIQNKLMPVLQPSSRKNPDFIDELKRIGADAFVVVAFRILSEEIFSMPPKGTVNVHPSLLPKYRGAAPINWAIINGERTTGVTTIFIKKEIDAGNIILQTEVQIQPDETAGSLHDRLADIGSDLLIETLNQIENDSVQISKQDETSATRAPKLTKETCHLDFNQPAEQVKNWIRGLSPYPGAYGLLNKRMVKFFRASLISSEENDWAPGSIPKITKDELWVVCNPGIVSILELQLEGHKRMEVGEFLRGHKLNLGENLS
jgi:methionyl-tRNA formyltransferase